MDLNDLLSFEGLESFATTGDELELTAAALDAALRALYPSKAVQEAVYGGVPLLDALRSAERQARLDAWWYNGGARWFCHRCGESWLDGDKKPCGCLGTHSVLVTRHVMKVR